MTFPQTNFSLFCLFFLKLFSLGGGARGRRRGGGLPKINVYVVDAAAC